MLDSEMSVDTAVLLVLSKSHGRSSYTQVMNASISCNCNRLDGTLFSASLSRYLHSKERRHMDSSGWNGF